jgi:hypothetical protein
MLARDRGKGVLDPTVADTGRGQHLLGVGAPHDPEFTFAVHPKRFRPQPYIRDLIVADGVPAIDRSSGGAIAGCLHVIIRFPLTIEPQRV